MAPSQPKKPRDPNYRRPSRSKPKTGWSVRELAVLSEVPVRTIRSYLAAKLLPRSRFLGTATRYQREHLLSLLAIRRLRATERLDLAPIRARLQALSPVELEAYATAELPPGAAARALGLLQAATGAAPASGNSAASSISLSPTAPRWVRLDLALGLELHISQDASTAVL